MTAKVVEPVAPGDPSSPSLVPAHALRPKEAHMKFKALVATAAAALAVVAGAGAPAAADPVPSGCDVHLETVIGGVCIPIP